MDRERNGNVAESGKVLHVGWGQEQHTIKMPEGQCLNMSEMAQDRTQRNTRSERL